MVRRDLPGEEQKHQADGQDQGDQEDAAGDRQYAGEHGAEYRSQSRHARQRPACRYGLPGRLRDRGRIVNVEFRVQMAREALAQSQALTDFDGFEVARMLGRLEMAVESLLALIDEQVQRDSD